MDVGDGGGNMSSVEERILGLVTENHAILKTHDSRLDSIERKGDEHTKQIIKMETQLNNGLVQRLEKVTARMWWLIGLAFTSAMSFAVALFLRAF